MYLKPVAAEPPPETTTLRLINVGGIWLAPQYVAEELLGGEGFVDAQYLKLGPAASYRAVAVGEAHLSMGFVAPQIVQIDAGLPIVLLAGVHVGCFELFGADRVRTVLELTGKSVAVQRSTDLAGSRDAHAPSPRAPRAWVWPALVSEPGRRRAPLEYAAGSSPTHVISWLG